MHIPDGFLDTRVWLTLDVVAVPVVGYCARKAGREADEANAPLFGVMGAFIFAAQMINFPVGVGTSGHLLGGALLAYTLGPSAAVVVMTAILSLQAFIFQDGGILALGANVFNMAIVGVAVAWLPYRLIGAAGPGKEAGEDARSPAPGNSRWRKFAIFAGATLSVLAAACFALSELLLSGIRMPGAVLMMSLGLFLVTAVVEGIITLAVIEALNRLNPGWIRAPAGSRGPVPGALAAAAILLASVGILFASALPDGIFRLAAKVGIVGRAANLIRAPLAGYEARFLAVGWPGRMAAGMTGLALIGTLGWLLGRMVMRERRN